MYWLQNIYVSSYIVNKSRENKKDNLHWIHIAALTGDAVSSLVAFFQTLEIL